MLIHLVPTPESDMAALSLAMPDAIAPSTSFRWGEVAKKRKKKEKNAVAKTVRRKVGHSDGESFGQLGHYLFAHSKAADLHQAKISKALQEAQAKTKRIRAEVDYLRAASKVQIAKVEHLPKALRREKEAAAGLKAPLTLAEKKKKKMEEEIGVEREWAIDNSKSSKAMEDIKIIFAREAFLEGF
ncbi:hypothetical protein COCNU_scaffold004131G000040 [Cocos nucifera]|nr:hypothetical protein [Cocos nucifera]